MSKRMNFRRGGYLYIYRVLVKPIYPSAQILKRLNINLEKSIKQMYSLPIKLFL